MNSIYDKIGNDSILSRINSLTPESKAIWGKMTVDQMCKHCSLVIDVSLGNQELKINFLMRLLGRILKNKVIYGEEWKKNSPTAKEFIVVNQLVLEEEKTALISKFNLYSTEGKSAIKLMNHPFWGKLTHEEWDLLQWKHIDHHLKQFGV
jgi:hypothetical protein